jgi:acyl-homoserine lactone acylase PvdQ
VLQSEGQTLISGLAIALSNCHVAWPAFVPVHDALRDAMAGVAVAGPASVFLQADGMPAIRAAKQPPGLLQVGYIQSPTSGCDL